MDLATVIGLVLSYLLLLIAILLGVGLLPYIDIPSVIIVIGGTIGIMLMNFPMGMVTGMTKIIMKTIFSKSEDQAALIQQLVDFAVKARRDGILSLESAEEELDDIFLKKGIRLAVDGTEPEVIKSILETDTEYMEERHKLGKGVLAAMQEFAPAMGMIGTLVGLVGMLQTMDDPASIGPSMAVALLTTFYGAIIANLFAGPLAGKLSIKSAEEKLVRDIMVAGIMAIQAGDNPRIVEQKLNAYLPPKLRQSQFD